MTVDQKKIAWLGTAVLVAMGLFPPWREMAARPLNLERSLGHAFLLTPPGATGAPYVSVGFDWPVLLTQSLVVIVAVAGLLWIFRARAAEAGLPFSDRLRQRAFLLSLLSGFLLPFPTGHGAPVIMVVAYSLVGDTGHVPRWSLILWSLAILMGYSVVAYGLAILASRLLRPTARGAEAPRA